MPNEYLKPVHISEFETGLNLSFFQSRLNFDMAYYQKKTSDDIATVSTSSASGYNAKVVNVGKIKNSGFEFMVDAYPVKTKAAETTFSGTVSDKTTSDILYLSTSGGTMEIKIDSSTQVSGTKLILPGSSITASCYRGSDEYWHASTLTGTAKVGKVTIDANNKATVKGTIAKGTQNVSRSYPVADAADSGFSEL